MDTREHAATRPELVTPPPADVPAVVLPLSAREDAYYRARAIHDDRMRAREALRLAEAMLSRLREMRP